ncbi:MAG TPA: GPO family capsid scaffolding protein [Rhodanobacter sp.]|jgi:hypothetical protein|nr:GPO family capsid scaffolding protein [Rhodanobacter sp.]
MAKSKFFRVAVEGATSDGRAIERSAITAMAATYNPAVYGARIFAEHIRGYAPDSPFKAYGDVTAVKAEEIGDGPLKGKLALYAQIDPTPEMVGLVKARQKIYSSIEITPKFADTGLPYLSGLGITDSPASLGTEILTFASQHPDANPFAARKQHPDNLFTAAVDPIEIEWEDEPADTSASTLFAAIKEKLAKISAKFKTNDGQLGEVGEALQGMADTLEQFATRDTAVTQQFADQFTALTARLGAIEAASTTDREQFNTLLSQLEAAPGSLPRPAASGGGNAAQTDC